MKNHNNICKSYTKFNFVLGCGKDCRLSGKDQLLMMQNKNFISILNLKKSKNMLFFPY
jgi:hypothetical protein